MSTPLSGFLRVVPRGNATDAGTAPVPLTSGRHAPNWGEDRPYRGPKPKPQPEPAAPNPRWCALPDQLTRKCADASASAQRHGGESVCSRAAHIGAANLPRIRHSGYGGHAWAFLLHSTGDKKWSFRTSASRGRRRPNTLRTPFSCHRRIKNRPFGEVSSTGLTGGRGRLPPFCKPNSSRKRGED